MGPIVDGQSRIMRTAGIERVWLTPDDVRASDDALAAIAEAELIVLGPGSLYTSLLPSLLIPAIRDAVAGGRRHAPLRLQRRDPGRRDGRARPGRPRRGARRAHGPGPRRPRPRQQPVRRAGSRATGRPRPSGCDWPPAGLTPAAAPHPRRRRRPGQRPPPRPGPARRRGPARLRGATSAARRRTVDADRLT